MSKVSVLVAVYNAEKYLRECLDSLCRQTLQDIQIVCVDDASNDHSLEILNEYAQRDSRFLVRQMPQKMVREFESHPQTDCVLLRLILFYQNGRQEEFSMDDFSAISGETAFWKSLNWSGIHGIYGVRNSIQKKYPYDESAMLFSDENTTRIHFLVSREVRSCEGIYYYRQHEVSMTHAVSRRRFDKMKATLSLLDQLKAMDVKDEVVHVLNEKVWMTVIDQYMDYFRYRPLLTEADRQYALSQIRQGWQRADFDGVPLRLLLKPGYMPLRFSWNLFRMQEEIYFSLRKLIGRI